MFANERYEIICDILNSRGSVTVTELCERFGVSIETIRRDLSALEASGKLKRVHGGAVSMPGRTGVFGDLAARLGESIDKKRELSRYAMQLISEDDTVYIDSGSTAIEFTTELCKSFRSLTVITNSTDVISAASAQRSFEIISLGGKYMEKERLFYGHVADMNLRMFHIDKCFLFPSCLSLKYGAMINVPESLPIERAAMEASDKVYFLADSTKFEINATLRICSLQTPDAIVTDGGLSDELYRLYTDNGINIIKE